MAKRSTDRIRRFSKDTIKKSEKRVDNAKKHRHMKRDQKRAEKKTKNERKKKRKEEREKRCRLKKGGRPKRTASNIAEGMSGLNIGGKKRKRRPGSCFLKIGVKPFFNILKYFK